MINQMDHDDFCRLMDNQIHSRRVKFIAVCAIRHKFWSVMAVRIGAKRKMEML